MGRFQITMSDALTSLIYASAISVILAKSAEKVTLESFLSIFMILYIFMDWLIRVGVPLTFPDDDQQKRNDLFIQLIKSSLEITVVFLLVIFFVLRFDEIKGISVLFDSGFIFGVFLLITFFWNVIVLFIMQKLSFLQLFVSSFNGVVFELEGADAYTSRFKKLLTFSEGNIIKSSELKEQIKNTKSHAFVVFKQSVGRLIAQIISNHISWVPILVAVLIFIKEADVIPYYVIISDNVSLRYFVFVMAIFLIPTIIFFISYYIEVEKGKECFWVKFLKSLSAILLIILLVSFYFSFDSKHLVYVIAAQQLLVGLVLAYATANDEG